MPMQMSAAEVHEQIQDYLDTMQRALIEYGIEKYGSVSRSQTMRNDFNSASNDLNEALTRVGPGPLLETYQGLRDEYCFHSGLAVGADPYGGETVVMNSPDEVLACLGGDNKDAPVAKAIGAVAAVRLLPIPMDYRGRHSAITSNEALNLVQRIRTTLGQSRDLILAVQNSRFFARLAAEHNGLVKELNFPVYSNGFPEQQFPTNTFEFEVIN
jgi:hypothetical protein